MKVAYLDCFSGISGDMFLGALLDAGLAFNDLETRLNTLPLDGYHLNIQKEIKNHISGTRFSVAMDAGDQPLRHLKDIREIITKSGLSPQVKSKSIEVFEELAAVEGKIHNQPAEKVHFHEVGAVDSIIDITGALIGIEALGIQSVSVSPIPLGSGFIETAHGTLPTPAPATIELLKGFPIYDSGVKHELVTPTGAALVKCLGASFGDMPPMIVEDIGYGAGQRDLPDRPNMLRILIGKSVSDRETETVVILETHMDDMNPEWAGFLMEKLFEAGALDVIFFPIQMKKNRPGLQVQVLGLPDKRKVLSDILFRESTTLGVRFHHVQREILKRTAVELGSPWGELKVKKITGHDGISFFQPEYEACREIALKKDVPLREIYNWVAGKK